MKDYTREQIFDGRPKIEPKKAIKFCIEQLIKDDEKEITDSLVYCLTYEELLGALLLAKDEMERLENEVNSLEDELDGYER